MKCILKKYIQKFVKKSKKEAENLSVSKNSFEFKSTDINEDELLASAASLNVNSNDKMHSLFLIQTKFLSADYEMVRMFGAKVVQSERQKANRNDSKFNFKNKIVNPKTTWPPFRKFGKLSLVKIQFILLMGE